MAEGLLALQTAVKNTIFLVFNNHPLVGVLLCIVKASAHVAKFMFISQTTSLNSKLAFCAVVPLSEMSKLFV